MSNNFYLKMTIALMSFALMGDFVVIPAIGGIYSDLPNANPVLLDFILTGPMMVAVLSSIMSGFLASYIRKKSLLIGSYILFILVTYGGALLVNIYYIVAMRALAGFATGMIAVTSLGLISEVFVKDAERSSMLGLFNGVMAGAGIILSFASGFLATNDWKNSFYLYLAGIPIVLMMIAYLPKTPPEGKGESINKLVQFPFRHFGMVAVSFLLFNALYDIVAYYIAIYLEEAQLGDASMAGVLSSLGTTGSLCACLLFSLIYLRFKDITPVFACLVMGVAYIVMSFPSNIWVIGIMCFLSGASYGLGISYFYMHASMIVEPAVISIAMGLMASCVYLGVYFSSHLLNMYKTVLNVQIIAPTFLYIGITLIFLAILVFISITKSKVSQPVHI
ncbi:MFS transporter [Sporomusa sp.]|uniref:MFS transporter n=1 Tax=Sporomusa sp. TaxID=2078658 RepID=UPI002CE6AB40|nr:MFS transporter [Sporomusa sp.]HWR42094.1 MFS transporter [Sporomusa sp.]